jgi:hypothetical protein
MSDLILFCSASNKALSGLPDPLAAAWSTAGVTGVDACALAGASDFGPLAFGAAPLDAAGFVLGAGMV